jgi:hypothetical protein
MPVTSLALLTVRLRLRSVASVKLPWPGGPHHRLDNERPQGASARGMAHARPPPGRARRMPRGGVPTSFGTQIAGMLVYREVRWDNRICSATWDEGK